ncbi:hypothetical protein AB2B38_007635 [Balneola sp. MJW-20]|uniref:hypothetical protein n=1 Tax=Gracilimonas aurantiaca TaxID=3234185 RepID=UPI0034675B2C
MKRLITKLGLLTILLVGLSGCYLKSVHPLFDEENAVFIEGLDGVYETEDYRWTFASDNNPEMLQHLITVLDDMDPDMEVDSADTESLDFKGYLIMYENLQDLDKKPDLFIGTAGEIGGRQFLNLQLFDMSDDEATLVQRHIFNINTFSRISLTEEELVMEPFASDWISEQIRNHRVRIKHEVVKNIADDGSGILITASTKELQAFVEKYKDEEDAYEDPIKLKRVTNAVQ